MSWTVYAAIVGWMIGVVVLFASMDSRRAASTALIAGWLFLPVAALDFHGLKGKLPIVCLTIFVAGIVFRPSRFRRLRFTLADLPVLFVCLWPFVADRRNGFDYYESVAASWDAFLGFGAAYVIGRSLFSDLRSVRQLARSIVVGGLIYVPLCLWEIRFSPQLHRAIYGFHQHSFGQTFRFGGFRPMVFMNHGLMVGMWMTAASLIGLWMWSSDSLHLGPLPQRLSLAVLLFTTLLCKSLGALVLLTVGWAVLWSARKFRSSVPLAILIAVSPAYIGFRVSGLWSGEDLAMASDEAGVGDRSESLRFRLMNERLLISKALQQKWTGWGRWGRSRVYDEHGRDLTVTDGLWIITLGEYGLVGLAALTATLLLPAILFLRRFPAHLWRRPMVAPAAALAVILVLFMIDCLFNAMMNPFYLVAAGAMTSACLRRPGLRRKGRVPRQEPSPVQVPALAPRLRNLPV